MDIDSIGNLEDLPRLVINNGGCWNLFEKELDGIDIDVIEILKDVTRLLFFHEEPRNPRVVVDTGEVTRNINKQKNLDALQVYRCRLKNAIGKSVSSTSIWNIVNQVGKLFSCD